MAKSAIAAGYPDIPPYFLPWRGETDGPSRSSSSERGTIWHVLGESHYIGSGDDAYPVTPASTRQIVHDWALRPSKGSAFFTRVASLIENTAPGEFDREKAWSSFTYSNYIQQPLPGPRRVPSKEQWSEAGRCFFGQLAISRPEILVVLGSRLWHHLPSNVGAPIPSFSFLARPDWPPMADAWLYPFWVDGELTCTVAVKVIHPSAGFGRWNWQTAAQRVQSARFCHSNILEYFYDHYQWPPH